jgi:hypothetical protein
LIFKYFCSKCNEAYSCLKRKKPKTLKTSLTRRETTGRLVEAIGGMEEGKRRKKMRDDLHVQQFFITFVG